MTAGTNGFEVVDRALHRETFGTLSTVTENGRPHATGVVYAVSPRGEPSILYVTTRTTTRKVRNIRAHPDVAFVVPIARRLLPVFPPRAVQFQGTATVVPSEHDGALRAFDSSWFLRRILLTERRIVTEGDDLYFIRIRPDPTVFTYGIGMSVWDNMRHPRSATGRERIPDDRLL